MVPLGTFLVAISFAIGSTVTDFIESVVFILGVQPYDVGDRVTIDHSMVRAAAPSGRNSFANAAAYSDPHRTKD